MDSWLCCRSFSYSLHFSHSYFAPLTLSHFSLGISSGEGVYLGKQIKDWAIKWNSWSIDHFFWWRTKYVAEISIALYSLESKANYEVLFLLILYLKSAKICFLKHFKFFLASTSFVSAHQMPNRFSICERQNPEGKIVSQILSNLSFKLGLKWHFDSLQINRKDVRSIWSR